MFDHSEPFLTKYGLPCNLPCKSYGHFLSMIDHVPFLSLPILVIIPADISFERLLLAVLSETSRDSAMDTADFPGFSDISDMMPFWIFVRSSYCISCFLWGIASPPFGQRIAIEISGHDVFGVNDIGEFSAKERVGRIECRKIYSGILVE